MWRRSASTRSRVAAWNVRVRLGRVQTWPHDRDACIEVRSISGPEERQHTLSGYRDPSDRDERIARHALQIDPSSRLIEGPQRFREAGIQLHQPSKGRRQILEKTSPIQRSKERP